jgi:hypothetical protein
LPKVVFLCKSQSGFSLETTLHPGAWAGSPALEISGAVAKELTDARLLSILRRAGPTLRALTVNDAGEGFTGAALVDHVREPLHTSNNNTNNNLGGGEEMFSLETLDLRRCAGLKGGLGRAGAEGRGRAPATQGGDLHVA